MQFLLKATEKPKFNFLKLPVIVLVSQCVISSPNTCCEFCTK